MCLLGLQQPLRDLFSCPLHPPADDDLLVAQEVVSLKDPMSGQRMQVHHLSPAWSLPEGRWRVGLRFPQAVPASCLCAQEVKPRAARGNPDLCLINPSAYIIH